MNQEKARKFGKALAKETTRIFEEKYGQSDKEIKQAIEELVKPIKAIYMKECLKEYEAKNS